MSQLQYWVWLSMRFGVRPKMKLALVEHFGTPRDVYFATEADYRVRVPLRPEELRLLLDKDLKDANRALAICDREHIRILTIQDAQLRHAVGGLRRGVQKREIKRIPARLAEGYDIRYINIDRHAGIGIRH